MTGQARAGAQRTPANADLLQQLEDELWLAKRLAQHGHLVVFEGVTDPEVRKQRMRAAIVDRGIGLVICARDPETRKSVNYEQAFERLYGEKLNGNPTRKGKPA